MDTTEKVAMIIAALKASGLGPSEIAREAHLSRQTVYRLEVGYCRMPSFDTVERLRALESRMLPVTDMIRR